MKRSLRTLVLAMPIAFAGQFAQAETPAEAAQETINRMATYLGGLEAASFTFDVAVEAVTTQGIKLQFPSSGTVLIERPGHFRITRTGAHADVMLNSDGKTMTLYGKRLNAYAQKDAPDSFDVFVETANEHGIAIPGADLLLTNVGEELTSGITDAFYLGSGPIDGVECEHVAFRTAEVDFQLWVATGDKPYPCRYVITSKWVAGSPQYQLQISDWNDAPDIKDDAFVVETAAGAQEIDIKELSQLDGLMPEVGTGEK